MQEKVDISEETKAQPLFFEKENKKILTISTHLKTTKTVVGN